MVAGLAVVAALTLVAAACGSERAARRPASTGATGVARPRPERPDGRGRGHLDRGRAEELRAGAGPVRGADRAPTARFLSAGDDIAAYLGPKIEGGQPPDVAILPQPGVLQSFADRGRPDPDRGLRRRRWSTRTTRPAAREVGTVDGTLYAVWFRAAQKSTVWYNTHVFADAGVEPPATWDELLDTAQTISDFGVPPYSVGVDVGWPLSDLFENIYLRTAGPEMYDQLAKHEIPWTDQSVKDALTTMADVARQQRPDRRRDARARCRPTSTGRSRRCSPIRRQGAIVFEGNFVGGVITGETEGEGRDRTRTSSTSRRSTARRPRSMGGGDIAVLLKDTEGGKELHQVPGDARGGGGLGRAGRLHLAEQERRHLRVHRPDRPARRARR